MKRPRVYFLIGAPSTGRTTFRQHLIKFHGFRGFHVVSFDDVVLRSAQSKAQSYSDIVENIREETQDYLFTKYRIALTQHMNIILDVDELLTKEERAHWLEWVPEEYERIAFVFDAPNGHRERNAQRKDYPIDWQRVEDALSRLVWPTHDEGFNEIVRRRM